MLNGFECLTADQLVLKHLSAWHQVRNPTIILPAKNLLKIIFIQFFLLQMNIQRSPYLICFDIQYTYLPDYLEKRGETYSLSKIFCRPLKKRGKMAKTTSPQ